MASRRRRRLSSERAAAMARSRWDRATVEDYIQAGRRAAALASRPRPGSYGSESQRARALAGWAARRARAADGGEPAESSASGAGGPGRSVSVGGTGRRLAGVPRRRLVIECSQ